MRKLLIAASALLVAASMVWADGIHSANVVGYSTINFKAGFNLVGVQFDGVGGGGISIQDLFSDVKLVGIDEDFNVNDFMQVWDLAGGAFVAMYYWCDDLDLDLGPVGWYSPDYDYVEYTFQPGDAFWIYTQAGGSGMGAVAAGEVVAGDVPIAIKSGFNLLCNPFPIDYLLNAPGSFSATGLVGVNEDFDVNDFIQVWDLDIGAFTAMHYWCDDLDLELGPIGWYSANYDYLEDEAIGANAAFWLYHNGSGATVTFGSPLAAQ